MQNSLNQFLLAFSYIGEPAIPHLREKRGQTEENADLHKWLALALGMAGDSEVADELRGVVLNDPDRYVRCVAVRAYSRSAEQDAIPVLESLLSDTTESEYEGCTPIPGGNLLIRSTAMGELSRLRRAATAGDDS